jgi:hypothetical protein
LGDLHQALGFLRMLARQRLEAAFVLAALGQPRR